MTLTFLNSLSGYGRCLWMCSGGRLDGDCFEKCAQLPVYVVLYFEVYNRSGSSCGNRVPDFSSNYSAACGAFLP